jgi:hypothetical protein
MIEIILIAYSGIVLALTLIAKYMRILFFNRFHHQLSIYFPIINSDSFKPKPSLSSIKQLIENGNIIDEEMINLFNKTSILQRLSHWSLMFLFIVIIGSFLYL